MKRIVFNCLILTVSCLVVAPATAQVVSLRIDAINPYEYLVTPPAAGTLPISTGLNVVPKGMRVYFVADTTGSGANVVSSFAWSITAVPGGSAVNNASLISTSAIKTSFVSDVVGDYTIQLVAGGKTLTQGIVVSTFRGNKIDTDCGVCHAALAPKAVTAWNEWRGSKHATIFKKGLTGMLEVETSYDGLRRGVYSKNCVKCHTTGWDQTVDNGNFGYLAHLDNGAIKAWDTTWYKDPVNIAAQGEFFIQESTMTNWTALTSSYAALEGVANIGCEQCHGPADAHASTALKTKIGKSFEPGVCEPCHRSSAKHSIGNRWAESKHGILAEGSHTAQPGCYPCHSGKAFVKWTANKAAPGYDTTTVGGQLSPTNDGNVKIGCSTCHDPHTLALRATTVDSLRNGYIPPANIGGAGKLCMNCHNSRYSVKTRVTSKGPYYGFTNRFGPHENGQADLYLGSNGYQYGDSTLTGRMTHQSLPNGCVTCHMPQGGNASSPVQFGHAMHMIDSLGAPTPLGLKACEPCHGTIGSYNDVKAFADYDGDGAVEGFQNEVQGLLDKLKNRLPKDPLTGEPVTMLKDSLLVKDQPEVVKGLWNYFFVNNDGSRGVHNPKYAVALLQKSLGITFTGVTSTGGPAPTSYALQQNFPNPFNPTTNISFSLPQKEHVRLDVYDILGRLVNTLVSTDLPAGNYTATWNGKDAVGSPLASGMYLYRLQAGSVTLVKKMLMVR